MVIQNDRVDFFPRQQIQLIKRRRTAIHRNHQRHARADKFAHGDFAGAVTFLTFGNTGNDIRPDRFGLTSIRQTVSRFLKEIGLL